MLKEILSEHGDYFTDKTFKELTTIRMGGPISHFVMPHSADDLKVIVNYLKGERIPFKVIGNGSNLICGSSRYDGVVISLKKLNNYEITNEEVYVEAGMMAPYFAQLMANAGLSGMEFASAIPGNIGGLTYMNAGAYKRSMSDIIKEVLVLKNGTYLWLTKDDMAFNYRYSLLQEHPHWIAIACKLELKKADPKEIQDLMAERLERRKNTQPLDKPSAGSCFRNPENDFAWKYIDELGYRGKEVNGVKVSEKHSNFIVNENDGDARDFLSIAYDIQEQVNKKHHIKLVLEVEKFNC